ncbi:topoisomerase DNA-binding C4 zinc finger domain-containing protein, partial [Patescibacteria group bacterium]|nr:topoisomerase DNA-binding C4 zinc finger domain-containing protein [Patescibacteria group bacterium]
VKKTMVIAQQLYEGVDLGSKGGHVGLITYMRTDSTYITPKVISDIRSWVENKLGKEYLPASPRVYKTKDKRAQEAHEAIRPSLPSRTPDDIASFLSSDQQKLYRLIWERTVTSQMADAIIDQQDVRVKADNKILTAQGVAVKFPGFMAVMAKYRFAEQVLPALKVGEPLTLLKIDSMQKFTEPSARYTEPSLIKTLEKLGIGRPSTYMPTITTITARGYVGREVKQLYPLEVGFLVNDFLVEHFPEIVDFEFTANMENDLDKIAEGEEEWQEVIGKFYKPFSVKLAEKEKTLVKKDLDEKTDAKCELCSAPMIIKMGRFGRFMACTKFPECKYTKSLVEKKVIMPCPKCEKGQVVAKRTKRGKIFWGCDTYPKCDFASWDEPVKDACPTCKGLMTISKKKKVPVCTACGFEDKEIK